MERWLCLTVAVPHDAAELVASFLTELGSLGVIESVRDLQQPASSTTEVQGFFPEHASRTVLDEALGHYIKEIADLFPGLDSAFPQFSVVSKDAWQDRWRDRRDRRRRIERTADRHGAGRGQIGRGTVDDEHPVVLVRRREVLGSERGEVAD